MSKKNTTKKITTVKFRDILAKKLVDEDFVEGYLDALLLEYIEHGNKDAFLQSVKYVADVRGGITKLSKKSGISRATLYKALSPKGNPTLETFNTILQSMGFRLKIEGI